MKIKNKLFLFITAGLLVTFSLIFWVNRMTVKKEIQEITKVNLQDIAFAALNLININKDMDKSAFDNAINKKITIGKTGFLFIVDSNGNMVLHKKAQGKNWISKPFISYIVDKKNGYHRYLSPKTNTYKVVAFKYYAPKDWIVVAGNFESDALAKPLRNLAKKSAIFLVPIFILIFFAFALFINNYLIKPLRCTIEGLNEGADQLASASGQVLFASQSLAEGTSEQAASIEETSSSLEEMSSMNKQNADNAGQANILMKEANQTVEKANISMNDLTTSMEEISKASEEISKIIKTIDEIAFQTNLLALNAAVEAARAGEAGAGFAVVADEVRNLAIRAADAAKNTADLIEGTVKKVKEGSTLVSTTNEAFAEVAESALKVGELVGEISEASNEQAQGIDQINTAVTQMMDQVTQQNAANAEESASASGQMNAQAGQMKGVVGELIAIVGANGKNGNGHQHQGGGEQKRGVRAFDTGMQKTLPLHIINAKDKEGNFDQVIPTASGPASRPEGFQAGGKWPTTRREVSDFRDF